MKVRPIPADVLSAYVAGLSAFVPGLTPTGFVAALRDFEPDKGREPDNAPPQRMLTLAAAADALSVSICTMRRMVKDGRMAGRKVGSLWRVPAAAVKALAEVGEG